MSYITRHPPWAHQRMALDKMAGKPAFALLMAMRTGKTKTLLDDWGRLEKAGLCPDLLVVAPAGVYRTWEVAIDEHLGDELLSRVEVCTWSAGMGTRAKADLDRFLHDLSRPRVLLVNVEALSTVPRARDLCFDFIKQRASMLAIDESTTIKSPKAKRTKYINRILRGQANYRRILTGLPTPKSPLDLYTQFEFLDERILGYGSYRSFMMRHAVMRRMTAGGRTFDVVHGYRDVDRLQARIAPYSARVLLEDCYDLPKKMYAIRQVSLTDEQVKAYREIKDFATTKLAEGEHVTATQVITQILRMHQVLCGHVGTEDGHSVEVPENRTKVLLDLLDEHDGKAIVWASYDADVRKIAAALEGRYGQGVVARFWGGNRPTREDEERRFLRDPNCRYMVATAAAGGRGRTWTVADLVVYYSNTADLEHRSQSEERAQGVDKVNSVLYVDLVVPGSVDEKMLHALRNKINMAATITGDSWKEWIV